MRVHALHAYRKGEKTIAQKRLILCFIKMFQLVLPDCVELTYIIIFADVIIQLVLALFQRQKLRLWLQILRRVYKPFSC